ncbi:ATP-dependent RNA helicase DHX58-like isoform X2 [Lineus longissimus]|uniref:ATP-dependent RNA helicase DHX58-like isoform X2 n=1 Tax=Lineus longissimus TaxID=88925 RepID=UPI00315CD144
MAEANAGLSQEEDRNRAELCTKYQDVLSRDGRLEAMILYRPELVRCLDPPPLLDHMGMLLSDEVIGAIKATHKNTGKIPAARQLLDALLASGKTNIYTSFLDILKQEGHEKAHGLMQGIRHIEKDQVFKQVLELFRKNIVQLLVVDVSLLNELVSEGCISVETKKTVQCMCDNVSNNAGASALLDNISMLIREWPTGFVRALTSSGNESVVELLSPDFLEPRKRIEDVLDDMVMANPGVPERPYDQDIPGLDDLHSKSSSLNSSDGQNVKQTTVNHGSGNFTLFAAGGSTVNISSTVNIQSPDGSLQDSDNSMSMDKDVRSEGEDFQFSASVDAMDAPPRDDSIMMSRGAASSASVGMGKNAVLNASDQSECGKSAVATGGEKEDDEHDEKQDSESTKEQDKDELVLYDYQEKLARPGIEGKNTIICAPTGSGKTIIAAGIMKDHLKRDPGKRKVIFLACEVALANQQNKQFEKFLSPEFKSFVISGGAESGDKVPPIKLLLHDYDIIVMTAQLLVNAMMSPKAAKFDNVMDLVKFDDFSMMIFDECHHTARDHPYNLIMTRYVDQKLEGHESLPQVLGLTASLGVGKAPSMSKAIEHVVTMCANLDAGELSNPDEEMMKQIHETSNKPIMKTTIANSRKPDPFLEMICVMMSDIEKKLKRSCEGEDKGFQSAFGSIPSEKGSQPYIQWLSRIQKPIESSTVLLPINRQRSLKYLSYLKTYNRALLINHECRTRDALEYLKEEFQKIESVLIKEAEDDDDFLTGGDEEEDKTSGKDGEQIWLEEQFEKAEPELVQISQDPRFKNPMLATLKEKILGKFPDALSKANGRGIIFVQTREMTVALCRWIQEDEDLKDWNPQILVGANAKDPGPASMTQTKQLNILDYFKSGEHKLLVATSVAEEGLDIQKCNLIIRYNYVTNEIAMVQSRGRARADDSSYEVVTGGTLGAKKAQKENLNKIREKMMLMAIETVKKMSKEEYERHVLQYQEKFSKERKITDMARMRKKVTGNQKGPYFLLCGLCTNGLCRAEDLRLLAGTHHSVLGKSFQNKYRTKETTKTKVIDDFQFKGKISCISCNQDLGVFALYKNVPFPLLKVSNLLIENVVKDVNNEPMLDAKNEPVVYRQGYKKWKDVPFTVHDITEDELKAALSVVEGPALPETSDVSA